MLLVTHIIIAISSIVYTTYLFISPLKARFGASYALVSLTLISGTALVIRKPAALVSACLSGLAYLACVSFGIAMARNRLRQLTEKSKAQ